MRVSILLTLGPAAVGIGNPTKLRSPPELCNNNGDYSWVITLSEFTDSPKTDDSLSIPYKFATVSDCIIQSKVIKLSNWGRPFDQVLRGRLYGELPDSLES
jgi:hypothetical protein